MTPSEDNLSGLVLAQSTAFARAGAKPLVARGYAELRIREAAEEWLRKGLEHKKTRQCDEAVECFERGLEIAPEDPILRLCLAESYYWGWGVRRDPVRAMCWFRQPAERGHAIAQCMLAYLYEAGEGGSQDLEQAVYWHRRSAEQGLWPSQSALAMAHGVGSLPLPVSSREMDFWRTKIEGLGDPLDESILAPLDPDGQGVPDDLGEALEWYRRAVIQRNGKAQYILWPPYSY